MQRRLAAVLAADIVGYSAMMGADEVATLETLRAFRAEIFGPAVAGRRGRIVKSMGDGWLVAFDSAADAVNAAMQVQDRLADHATVKLRIGVHVGDVVQEESDLFGDGVNVAARLEALARPGGIAISEPAFASLDGTLAPAFDEAGEQVLKNIPRPVRVWTRAPRTVTAPAEALAEGAMRAAQGFPRLVLRPVPTSDPRAAVQEIADGLTSDLDAYLGSVHWLVSQVAETPPAGTYDLRCTLRSSGDRLRLEARLFGPAGTQLWSSKVDGTLDDAFDWQDEAGEEVAGGVVGAIFDTETAKLGDPDAMSGEQCLLNGMMRFRSFGVETYAESLGWFALAIERNPALLDAYAEAIFMTHAAGTVGQRPRVQRFFDALPGWVAQARPQAGGNVLLGLCIAIADFFETREIAPLRRATEDAVRRAPFDARVLGFAGWAFLWSGNQEAALAALGKGRRLRRFDAYAVAVAGCEAVSLAQLGRDEEALAVAQAALRVTTTYPALHAASAVALAHLGRQAEAEAAVAEILRLTPDRTISGWRAFNDYGGSAGGDRHFEGLRRAGLPE
jgi:adenylate cyclase